jgi:hypothetical protein
MLRLKRLTNWLRRAWQRITAFARKARSFARAILSLARWGPVSLPTYNDRTDACLKCPELKATLINEFCKACDCPEWSFADLRLKRLMRDLRCPLNKW